MAKLLNRKRLLHRKMVDVTDMDFPKALHNFGIFKKSGKRAILQVSID